MCTNPSEKCMPAGSVIMGNDQVNKYNDFSSPASVGGKRGPASPSHFGSSGDLCLSYHVCVSWHTSAHCLEI